MKVVENDFVSICYSSYVFVGLKYFGLWVKKLFLGLYAKACSYIIHVKHFAFGPCIVYIVNNTSTELFFKFLFFIFV